jgi:hypothetical protein
MTVTFTDKPKVTKQAFTKARGSLTIMTAREWFTYLNNILDFLWIGGVRNDQLVSIFGDYRITLTGRDFSGAAIAGDSRVRLKMQASAKLIEDDTDNLWFTPAAEQKDVTVTQLITGDYRTLVKYANEAPFDVTMIGLYKKTVTPNETLINYTSRDFWLWLFWSGFWNDYGYMKDNRLIP